MTDDLEHCRRCDLWKAATQAVPGEGGARAQIMLVGEQPGNEEDLKGHPFVGPAGHVLDQCLEEVGIRRAAVYVTNAVRHFKWKPSGKRRLHERPNLLEIYACNVWLRAEIEDVKPAIIVALGATALRTLMGRSMTIDAARRQTLQESSGITVLATYHPSAILRAPIEGAVRIQATLISDLKRARVLSSSKT